MAFLRKSMIKRRSTIKRRPRLMRKRYISRKRGAPRSALTFPRLQMTRTNFVGTWSFATTTTNDFWRYFTFSAANIGNFTDMSNLFDEYRINAIKVTFRPRYDSVIATLGGGLTTLSQAYAHVIVDPASTLLPSGVYAATTLNTFLENQGVKTYTLNRPFSIYLKPKVQDSLQGGGTSTRVISPSFVKTSETGVDHRGFHMYLQQNAFATDNTQIKLDMYYTFYLTLRNTK